MPLHFFHLSVNRFLVLERTSSQRLPDLPVIAGVDAVLHKRRSSNVVFLLRKDSFMLPDQFLNMVTLFSG